MFAMDLLLVVKAALLFTIAQGKLYWFFILFYNFIKSLEFS